MLSFGWNAKTTHNFDGKMKPTNHLWEICEDGADFAENFKADLKSKILFSLILQNIPRCQPGSFSCFYRQRCLFFLFDLHSLTWKGSLTLRGWDEIIFWWIKLLLCLPRLFLKTPRRLLLEHHFTWGSCSSDVANSPSKWVHYSFSLWITLNTRALSSTHASTKNVFFKSATTIKMDGNNSAIHFSWPLSIIYGKSWLKVAVAMTLYGDTGVIYIPVDFMAGFGVALGARLHGRGSESDIRMNKNAKPKTGFPPRLPRECGSELFITGTHHQCPMQAH